MQERRKNFAMKLLYFKFLYFSKFRKSIRISSVFFYFFYILEIFLSKKLRNYTIEEENLIYPEHHDIHKNFQNLEA